MATTTHTVTSIGLLVCPCTGTTTSRRVNTTVTTVSNATTTLTTAVLTTTVTTPTVALEVPCACGPAPVCSKLSSIDKVVEAESKVIAGNFRLDCPASVTTVTTTTSTPLSHNCETPSDPNGGYRLDGVSGSSITWVLICNQGYTPDPMSGNLAKCESSAVTKPNPCTVDIGCNVSATASTCGTYGTTVSNGFECQVTCVAPLVARGTFVCMAPKFEGSSTCEDQKSITVQVNQVSASFEMAMDVEPTEAFISKGIADAIDGVSIGDIHSVSVAPVARRLEAAASKLRRLAASYTVGFVLNVPDGMQAAVLVDAASSLSAANSPVQQAFKQSLQQSGVAVSSVSTVVAPRSFSSVRVVTPQTVTVTVPVPVPGPNIPVPVPGPSVPVPVPVPVPGPATTINNTVIVPVPVPTPVPTPGESDDNTGALVGAIVGTFAITLILVAIICAAWRYRNRKDMELKKGESQTNLTAAMRHAPSTSAAPSVPDRLSGYEAGDIVQSAKDLTGGGRILVKKGIKGVVLGPAGEGGEIAVRFDERADLDGAPDTVHVMPNEVKPHPDFIKIRRAAVELPTE